MMIKQRNGSDQLQNKVIRFKMFEGQLLLIYCGQDQGAIENGQIKEIKKHYEELYETTKQKSN